MNTLIKNKKISLRDALIAVLFIGLIAFTGYEVVKYFIAHGSEINWKN